MWREDGSDLDEAKKIVFSSNCTALQRKNDKETLKEKQL